MLYFTCVGDFNMVCFSHLLRLSLDLHASTCAKVQHSFLDKGSIKRPDRDIYSQTPALTFLPYLLQPQIRDFLLIWGYNTTLPFKNKYTDGLIYIYHLKVYFIFRQKKLFFNCYLPKNCKK